IKGGPSLKVVAQRDGQQLPVGDGTRLFPGDTLRFIVEPGELRHVLVASVDAAGGTTIYYPYGGRASMRLAEGTSVELPGGIELDDAPGPERVFVLLSRQPFGAELVL